MKIQHVTGIFFSPTGYTREIVQHVAESFDEAAVLHDLASYERGCLEYVFDAQDLVVVGVPVYGGRVPALAIERMQKIKGNRTPVIILATYGNRDYEDALLELKNTLEMSRFVVVGAAALVTEHSIVHAVGRGRPDAKDKKQLEDFLTQLKQKLEQTGSEQLVSVPVAGNYPYRKYNGIPLKPKVNKNCVSCGFCARECPTNAISADNPRKTDHKRCISCMRCVTYCPQEARYVNKIIMTIVSRKLEKLCSARRENVFSI